MRLEPVVAHAVVDHQAHLEGGGGFHAFGDDGRDALLFERSMSTTNSSCT